MDLQRGFESYKTAKLNNIKPNAMTYANLLSLTAGFGDQGELKILKRFHLLNMFLHYSIHFKNYFKNHANMER
jgi:hypothetical protein